MLGKSPTFLLFDHHNEQYFECQLDEFVNNFNEESMSCFTYSIVKIDNEIITDWVLEEFPLEKYGGIFC